VKLNQNCDKSNHFKKSEPKSAYKDCFGISHYAGEVLYNVAGFLDKNKDTLFQLLKDLLNASTSPLIKEMFPPDVVQDKKRPPTAGSQFKNQVTSLVQALMSCNPHYIRCIRPNPDKKPNNLDLELTMKQVKYLGLLENVRVRRAGYAYRQTYEKFLKRFKMVCKKTWPNYTGPAKDGCKLILDECGITKDCYEFGLSKVFIRDPQTLFTIEDIRTQKVT